MLAPYTSLKSAAKLAERVRLALASADLVVGGGGLDLKASIGVAGGQGCADDADKLLRQADRALYRAKEKGGYRTELAA